jgi:hypothetical protein
VWYVVVYTDELGLFRYLPISVEGFSRMPSLLCDDGGNDCHYPSLAVASVARIVIATAFTAFTDVPN